MSNLVNTSGWLGAGVAPLTRYEAVPTMARPRPGQIVDFVDGVFGDGMAIQRYGVRNLA